MTPQELYNALDQVGADYEIVEIFEGVRVLSILVDEPTDEELDEPDNPQGTLA